MGTGETGTSTKAAKVSTTQDQQSGPTSYSEWAAAFQAFYNSGGQPPPGYFPPSVTSGPQPHPYMWGGQPMMPPYGTPPPPFGAMYSHGGLYGHHTMPPGAHPYGQFGMPSPGGASEGTTVRPQATAAGLDAEGNKTMEVGKDRSPLKRSKGSLGSLGMLTVKGGDVVKGNSSSANGVFSQSSAESGSEGSSDGSEDDNTENILQKRSFEQMTLEAVGIGGSAISSYHPQVGGAFVQPGVSAVGGQSVSVQPTVSGKGPTTSLGIGIQDYWSGSTSSGLIAVKGGKRTASSLTSGLQPTTSSVPVIGGSRDGVPPELWLQDEREVKRQRRKQSNRESARRSRLRKQAECEELGTRVDTLTVQNMALRTELTRLSEECKKLTTENTSLLEQVKKLKGEESSFLMEQDGTKNNLCILQVESNGSLLDTHKVDSPRRNAGRREDETSCDSSGKVSSALDPGTRPEAVAAR